MSSYHHNDPKVIKKRKRIRAKSSSVRFELSVQKTNKHIVAILFDTEAKRDIASTSTKPKSFVKGDNRMCDALTVGKNFGELCKKHNITQVYFNKLSYKFHGILKQVVDGAKQSGINI
jgi:large subunit ribosomal protein L18